MSTFISANFLQHLAASLVGGCLEMIGGAWGDNKITSLWVGHRLKRVGSLIRKHWIESASSVMPNGVHAKVPAWPRWEQLSQPGGVGQWDRNTYPSLIVIWVTSLRLCFTRKPQATWTCGHYYRALLRARVQFKFTSCNIVYTIRYVNMLYADNKRERERESSHRSTKLVKSVQVEIKPKPSFDVTPTWSGWLRTVFHLTPLGPLAQVAGIRSSWKALLAQQQKYKMPRNYPLRLNYSIIMSKFHGCLTRFFLLALQISSRKSKLLQQVLAFQFPMLFHVVTNHFHGFLLARHHRTNCKSRYFANNS